MKPKRDSARFIDKYLGEIIDYGGEPYTRAEVILHMQSIGATQGMIDRWFQGYEFAQRRRQLQERVTVQLFVQTGSSEGV